MMTRDDNSEQRIKAIMSPGKLVKVNDGWYCNSGKCIYVIKKRSDDQWCIYDPEGFWIAGFDFLEQARDYVERGDADEGHFPPEDRIHFVACKTCGGCGRVFWDYDDPELEATVEASADCPDCAGSGVALLRKDELKSLYKAAYDNSDSNEGGDESEGE
jgi:hypothetical protein